MAKTEMKDYNIIFQSLINLEQNILINCDKDFIKKLKDFIDNNYDSNNISTEYVEILLNKNVPFYLEEKEFYHFIGPKDKIKKYDKDFTFKEVKEKIGNMNEYQIYLKATEGECSYIVGLRKNNSSSSTEWKFKIFSNKIITLQIKNVYD